MNMIRRDLSRAKKEAMKTIESDQIFAPAQFPVSFV